ncbi:hypothetical protein RISK_005218 [Rhodopirellula islandica]|uniref:Polysaccharide pyruvyl transferase domain-containing protein n=1 Tax=Rhodopirellula islandica TaxID=595434 RepID=A0A0J1B885_RHOIS|nr:polysaccharide pyruvyl transferase family protein [Rhodopirellula islandica]KLU02922.1 hypothetical protein RISK_005218 [Rhodopirellula islandica]
MTIGILTFHDGPNHGAFLQAWSTLQTLRSAGHDAHIINYKNPEHQQMERPFKAKSLRNPINMFRSWQKTMAFARDQRRFNLGPQICSPSQIDEIHYNTVVIGSDVVWNYQLFGYDPVFFGRVNAKRRIAFSASAGSVTPRDQHPPEMQKDLTQFDAISVRDQNTLQIVKEVASIDATVTLDPALMYDFTIDCDVSNARTENTLLVYSFLQSHETNQLAKDYASAHQLQIKCIGYPPPLRAKKYCDIVDMTCGPFEFIQEFSKAHTVLTSTFHGVVFSLKSGRPFLFVSSNKTHNRVASLLDTFGIAHELELDKEGAVHLFSPNYSSVTQRIRQVGKETREWLLSNL